MITYLLKFIACSALLWLLHRWVLEKEKMPVFNRFYLLFSLVFSALVPLFTAEVPMEQVSALSPENILPFSDSDSVQVVDDSPDLPSVVGSNWYYCLWIAYGVVTLGLLLRFGRNLFAFRQTIRRHPVIKNHQMKLVLVADEGSPYSFGGYIFVPKDAFEKGEIESEILAHEQAHIRQRHSLDVVFMELVLAFGWWNPVLWLYRRSMLLNHEFLADEQAIKSSRNTSAYQYLLLRQIGKNSGLLLANSFNYLITKKRFTMMNKIPSLSRAYAMQTGTAVLFAVLLLAFGNISFAQLPPPPPPPPPPAFTSKASREAIPFTLEGVSQEQVEEYNQIVAKYLKKGVENGKEWSSLGMPNETDRARLEIIFKTMSKEQQRAQQFAMNPPLPPLFRATPTEKEFEAYKNPNVYGVWINEKKVPNTELNKYKVSDFSQVFVSKLVGAGLKTIGYKYKYQLDLMTNDHYDKYRAEKLADRRYWLGPNREKMNK